MNRRPFSQQVKAATGIRWCSPTGLRDFKARLEAIDGLLLTDKRYKISAAMILDFEDQDTADLFAGKKVKRFANIAVVAERKLQQLDSAASVDALRVPPGNRLEALKGDRKGQYSIRINEQFRLCFVWEPDGVRLVQIVDYH